VNGGPVVVAVSPTTGSPEALRWADREAHVWGAELRAVTAWRPPRPPAAPAGRPPLTVISTAGEDYAALAEESLREFVALALGSVGKTDCAAVRGSAMSVLLGETRRAQLLVIGEPRGGRIGSVRTGMIAPQLVLKADCPVVVMPRSGRPDEP
jgi:nucleotide-binding universal stress UspA family protein